MSNIPGGSGGGGGGNKTVFRPSPLQALKGGNAGPAYPPAQADWGQPAYPPAGAPAPDPYGAPPQGYAAPPQQQPAAFDPPPPLSRGSMPSPGPALAPSRLAEDDVPLPATPRKVRNIMLTEAAPVLALAAGIRSGRARVSLPQFHREASEAIAAFDRAAAPHYSEETRQRAKYALCGTIDDIAQNLPGIGGDGAEWARRSLVVMFFRENIGGDRFWQLVDDMLRTPSDNLDLIELYHACLAAGFEGRFRVMPDGRRRLQEIMARLQGALTHVRSLSQLELSPKWHGEKAPVGRIGSLSYIAIAAAAAAGLLLLVYIVLRVMLSQTGEAPQAQLAALAPEERLRMSRGASALPAPAESEQASRLAKFLEPEINEGLVKVEEDAQTVRVRTTVGQLFESGSDQLVSGREQLFRRIANAIEKERGSVTVEGHADSDPPSSRIAFPDNMALSEARAETVASIIRSALSDAGRVSASGLGETRPIASNANATGKATNRRVEIVVPRVH